MKDAEKEAMLAAIRENGSEATEYIIKKVLCTANFLIHDLYSFQIVFSSNHQIHVFGADLFLLICD